MSPSDVGRDSASLSCCWFSECTTSKHERGHHLNYNYPHMLELDGQQKKKKGY